jgi:hypothetical protein
MRTVTSHLLFELLSYDHAFHETRYGAPPEASLRALGDSWARHPDIATGLEGSGRDWAGIEATLRRLSEGELRIGSGDAWTALAREGEQLADADPVAASLVCLHAMAAWEGAVGESLLGPEAGLPNPGWAIFPLALLRCLVRADALWGASPLVRIGLDAIESAKVAHSDPQVRETVDDYLTVQAAIDRRFAELRSELAWELRESCAPSEPSFRPEVAALMWTLGDVPHALSLSATTTPPSLALIEGVVHESMRRLQRDPFTQYVWLELKDRPPFDLRAHKILFARINAVHSGAQAQRFEGVQAQLGLHPATTYALALIAHFRGAVTEEVRQAVREVGSTAQMLPTFGVRFASLLRLIGAVDGGESRSGWQHIAADCTDAVQRARRLGEDSDYDLSLDIPLHYLGDGAGPEALDALERYRAAGLWYWLAIAPPARRPEGNAAEPLVGREDELLDELRGLHLVRLLPELPRHYSRATVEAGTDTHTLLDPELARERLLEVGNSLDEVHRQLAGTDPAYAARRRDPAIGLDEFARLLGPH